MTKLRKLENIGLPTRWIYKSGSYYYCVPPGEEGLWHKQVQFNLGKSLDEAHQTFNEMINNGIAITIEDVNIHTLPKTKAVKPGQPCVYFLFDGDEVVYVGKSRSLLTRIEKHVSKLGHGFWTFDSYAFMEVGNDKMNATEIYYINKIKPRYNTLCA